MSDPKLEVVTVDPIYEICDDDGMPVATVEVTDADIVPLGEHFAYRQITWTAKGLKLIFEVRDGQSGCVRIELDSADDGTFVRTKDLTAIRIEEIRAEALAMTAVTKTEDGRFVHRLNPATHRAARRRIESTPRRRRMTPELLRRTAQIYASTPDGERIDALKAEFGVNERQVLRYVAQARKEGMLT